MATKLPPGSRSQEPEGLGLGYLVKQSQRRGGVDEHTLTRLWAIAGLAVTLSVAELEPQWTDGVPIADIVDIGVFDEKFLRAAARVAQVGGLLEDYNGRLAVTEPARSMIDSRDHERLLRQLESAS